MMVRLVRIGETAGKTPVLQVESGFKRCREAKERPRRFVARARPSGGPCVCVGCDRLCALPLDIATGQEFEVRP